MEIKQILEVRDMVYGIGVDNLMYRWDFNTASWVPYWNTEIRRPATVVIPDQ